MADLRRALETPGCPACRRTASDGRRWLETFGDEHYTDPEIVGPLQRAGGICPSHGRELAAGPAASWVLPSLALGVIRVHRPELASGRPAAAPPCPVCVQSEASSHRANLRLARAGADPAVSADYRAHGGLCVEHVLALAPELAAPVTQSLVGACLDALKGAGPRRDAVVIGCDVDAPVRERRRVEQAAGLLAGEVERRALPALAMARAAAAHGGCAACLADALATWRYLDWLLTDDAVESASQDEMLCCARHLADVELREPSAARERVLASNAERMARFLDGALGAGRRGGAHARLRCRVCAVTQQARARAMGLLDAAWADVQGRSALEGSHGLCLQHTFGTTSGSPWRVLLAARLGLAQWELEEIVRRTSWSTRWEAESRRAGVASAALELLDGRITLGLARID